MKRVVRHRCLPRIQTQFNLKGMADEATSSNLTHLPRRRLPTEIVERIVSWAKEFKSASVKLYYYSRFFSQYERSLYTSSSRLQLHIREFKAVAMKHKTINEPPTLLHFLKDTNRCKRKYNYEELKGIFF